jgi:EAL and modified HD-GYP domain-containing signal transduction protein
MESFVTRQPVFDINLKIFAYDLLYRKGFDNTFFNGFDKASSSIINTSFFSIGINELTRNKKAIIKFTSNLLHKQIATLFPKKKLLIELPNNIEINDQLLVSCEKLKREGYEFVFDNFSLSDLDNPILNFLDFIKVNFSYTSLKEKLEISKRLKKHKIDLIASNIENLTEFNTAVSEGYVYFQGNFFDRPIEYSTKEIPGHKLNYIRLLRELYKSDTNFDKVEKIIKQDVSLSHKLLRLMNSAYFGFSSKIQSIKHACLLLGINEIKKWFSLIALSGIAKDKPDELIVKSVFRARFCENLGHLFNMEEESSELYMMGLFSSIDAILDKPMAVLLAQLPIPSEIKLALLGVKNKYNAVFEIVLLYEKGDWKKFSEKAKEYNIDEQKVPKLHEESIKWTNQVFEMK